MVLFTPSPGHQEGLLCHRDAPQLYLHFKKQKTVYWHEIQRIGWVRHDIDAHRRHAVQHNNGIVKRGIGTKKYQSPAAMSGLFLLRIFTNLCSTVLMYVTLTLAPLVT
jgi:hypothetical protein